MAFTDLKGETIIAKKYERPRYQCIECGYVCTSNITLVAHQRIHTGEKPFGCSHCEKFFRVKDKLVIHERLHTGEKPYQCNECDRAFSTSSNLKRHLNTHTGEKPYQCSICGTGFLVKNDLLIHIRIHTGEKPFECSVCEKTFRQKTNYLRHKRLHSGEKPYECSDCGKAFIRNEDLFIHKRKHTGERPYVCGICGKGFLQNKHLKQHIPVMHKSITEENIQKDTSLFSEVPQDNFFVTGEAIDTIPNAIHFLDDTHTTVSPVSFPSKAFTVGKDEEKVEVKQGSLIKEEFLEDESLIKEEYKEDVIFISEESDPISNTIDILNVTHTTAFPDTLYLVPCGEEISEEEVEKEADAKMFKGLEQ